MIRYNNKIVIKKTRVGEYIIESDRGDRYHTNLANKGSGQTPLTYWWDNQNQTELRHWQMDALIKEYSRQQPHGILNLYFVYKKGEGYTQPHDVVLAHDPNKDIWILSTMQHTWFELGGKSDIECLVDNALGSVTEADDRKGIYKVIDGLQHETTTN